MYPIHLFFSNYFSFPVKSLFILLLFYFLFYFLTPLSHGPPQHPLLRFRLNQNQKSEGGLVPPSGPTPCDVLDLSLIDKLPVLRCNARTLHVFKHGPNAAQIIQTALSKALVPYYPLAGRLKVSSQNELQIACSGEGIWFVEAFADCKLDAVNYFDDAMSIPYDKLLPDYPPESDHGLDPLVLVQVTQFGCDGFVMGLIFCHSVCDGLGAAQFLNAVGELAKGGVDKLSVEPVWCRDLIQQPPAAPLSKQLLVAHDRHNSNNINITPPMPPVPPYQLEHVKVDISFHHINQFKQTFQDYYRGQTCSTFEVVAAHLWSSRTKAIHHHHDGLDTQVKLVFFANCRQLILNDQREPLPKGFYGNCFFPVTIATSSGTLRQASNAQVVKMIQEAKARLPIEFEKWIKGDQIMDDQEGLVDDPFAPPLVYTTLFISEWGRLGFNQVDYGWGPPLHVVPIQGSSIIPVGIVGSVPSPGNGVRLMTWCVEKPHLHSLVDRITKVLT